jgi:D-threonate/D-erythronate kinase
MARVPIIVIADDLTGAAEIAAIGDRHGLASIVLTDVRPPTGNAGLIVYDTDSRLDQPGVAAEKIGRLARVLVARPRDLIYKKTDSVLRGAVRAELESLAAGLGCSRVLLVPANPALGRVVRDGRYAIGGVPLHHTTFARDPHHPATTDSMRELLGNAGTLAVFTLNPTDRLPAAGLIAGNATNRANLDAWARQLSADVLPAGGAEFFSAVLSSRGLAPVAHATGFFPAAPTLVVSGTASSAGAILRDTSRRDHVPIVPMPAEALSESPAASAAATRWIDAVQNQLATAGRAIAVFDGPHSVDPRVAAAIRAAFANCVRELVGRGALRHLIVEGGATAATITGALGWNELQIAHEWSTGVASLQPVGNVPVVVTMKPGSYAWPDELWRHILHPRPASSNVVKS